MSAAQHLSDKVATPFQMLVEVDTMKIYYVQTGGGDLAGAQVRVTTYSAAHP